MFKNKKKIKRDKQKSINDYINVLDIKHNILYTKDGYIFKYIKIDSISTTTISNTDLEIMIKSLTSIFSSQKEPIIFFKIGRPIDISQLIDKYSDIYQNTENIIRRELLRNASSYLHKYAVNNAERKNEYYMIIYIRYNGNNEEDIEKLALEYKSKLNSIKCKSKTLLNEDIMRLCSLFVNPSFSHLENIDLEEELSILERN